MTINATTDGGVQLDDFEVYIDGSNSTEALDVDNKTTMNTFIFGDTHDIVVKKVGHKDANQTNYMIKHPDNVIDLNLPKKRVGSNEKFRSYVFKQLFQFQYPLIINATTDGGEVLVGFEVYIDSSNVSEALESDNITTSNTFVFGDIHDIFVRKVGHHDANETSYMIIDPENTIHLNLPKKRVSLHIFLIGADF